MTVKSNRSVTLDEIVTAPIPKFQEISGLGPTKINELIKDGVTDDNGNVMRDDDGNPLILETVAIGSRRLIILASWRRIVEHQRQHPVKLRLRGRK